MLGNIDQVCAALDDLTLKTLELVEEKVSVTVQMEELLREGHIELAKARYVRGTDTVGILQIPAETGQIESLFEVHRYSDDEQSFPQLEVISKKVNDSGKDIQDPIKWFGVLVPQSLRNAQKRFQAALQLSGKCANVRSEIISVTNKLEGMKVAKRQFLENEE